MKKKLLALTLGLAITLTSSIALAMSPQEAKDIADTFVPDYANYSKLMNLKNEIEFYYRTDNNHYEVEFDTKRDIVKGLRIKHISPFYSTAVNIDKDEVSKILHKYYPDAQNEVIVLERDSRLSKYHVTFTIKDLKGKMNVLASDGMLLGVKLDRSK